MRNSNGSPDVLKTAWNQRGTEVVHVQAGGPCDMKTPKSPDRIQGRRFGPAIVLVAFIMNSMPVRAQEAKTPTARIEGKAMLTANVGMMASIQQVVFPGTELIPRKTDFRTAPVVIRIDAVYPHGAGFRYDLTWTAFESGSHDLSDYLVRKDGTTANDLPSLEVTANSILPTDQITPNAPDVRPAISVGGYRMLVWMAVILWFAGLAWFVVMSRNKSAITTDSSSSSPQTRLDSIRRLLQLATSGNNFSAADKAKLEGLIVGFWREHKQIQDLSAQIAFARLREDTDAGPLLKQLERWLYDRPQLNEADLSSLLLPLQAMVERAEQQPGILP